MSLESFVSFQHTLCSFKLTRTAAIHPSLFIHHHSSIIIHRPPFIIFISSIQYSIAPLFLFIVSFSIHRSNKTRDTIDAIDAYWRLNSVHIEAIQTSNRFMPVRLQSVLGWYKNHSLAPPLCCFFFFCCLIIPLSVQIFGSEQVRCLCYWICSICR